MDEAFGPGPAGRAGARLGDRYTLERPLGGGGMAVVYRAHDERLDRPVAVKLFDPVRWPNREYRARFEQEALAAASISHPNVVAVHDFGVEGDTVFIVMECLPGTTLTDEIRRGPLSAARAVTVTGAVLAGLGAAHAKGVLHRDIKPSNVLLDEAGRAKLGDFGIATLSGGELTETGVVIGTPAYLAPERVAGGPASVRTDLYSVGVMTYQALAGVPPFTGDTPLALAHAIHTGTPRELSELRPDAPRALCDAVMRAIARDPDARPATAGEFARLLDEDPDATRPSLSPVAPARHDRTTPLAVVPARAHPRRGWLGLAGVLLGSVVVGLLIGGIIGALRDDSDPGEPATDVTVSAEPALPEPLSGPFDQLEEAVRP